MDRHMLVAPFHLVSINEKLQNLGKFLQIRFIGLPLSGLILGRLKETYQQLTQERDSQIKNNTASSYSDNKSLFIQAAGGFDKRGRVFVMGASASELKSSAKRSSNSVGGVPAEDKRVKALEAKVKEQGEMIIEMRTLLRSILKDKGMRLLLGGDDDTGGDYN